MTGSSAERIARSHLELGRPLGDGGQGVVREVEKRLINKSWPIAYKEYKPKALNELAVEALERMVDFLPGRPPAVGEWMAQNTAWPAALVTEGPSVRGFLMRQIPDEYFITLPSGLRKTAGFEFLLNPLPFVRTTVGEVSPKQMLGLLLALADTLQRLHDLDVVAGDLSPKNLLFTLNGSRPQCFLIDCDAMGLAGNWALQPVETPGWELPAGEAVGTQQGDTYKFALLAVRLFLHEQHGQDPGPLREVAPQVGDLAERTLTGTPLSRPSLADWLDPLGQAYDLAPDTWPGPARTPTVATPGPSAGSVPRPGASVPRPGGPVPRPGASAPGRTRAGSSSGGRSPQVPPVSPSPRRGGVGCVVALVILMLLLAGLWAARAGLFSGTSENVGTRESVGTSESVGTTDAGIASTDTREEQVIALDHLLSRNAGRRKDVAASVSSLLKCTDLRSAQRVFTDAAQARAGLLTDLGRLSADELPDGMTSDLRTAWQSSEKVDRSYARVADEVSGSCTSQAVSGSRAWRDADEANAAATRAKEDFVKEWNPLAPQYALSTRAWTDL